MLWVSLSAQRLDFDGEPAIATALIDITERMEAERRLQESEEHFRRLIENASDLISIISPEGITLYQSPALTRLLGYEQEEMLGIDVPYLSEIAPGRTRLGIRTRAVSAPGWLCRMPYGLIDAFLSHAELSNIKRRAEETDRPTSRPAPYPSHAGRAATP